MTFEFKPIPAEDLDAYFDLLNDESLARNAGTVPYPITKEWAQERLSSRRAQSAEGTFNDRGLYEDGTLVAVGGYFFKEFGLEIGYSVHRDHRGRGLATKLAKLAVKLARDNRCSGPIAANYFQDNPASGRVLEKVGFKNTGVNMATSSARNGEIPGYTTSLAGDVMLSVLHENDYALLFEFQNDKDAQFMAGGGAVHADEAEYRAFLKKKQAAGADIRTILLEGVPVGYVASFERFGNREISYWIGRRCWGQGLASKAVALWLEEFERPEGGLYARVVDDHPASARVLEKNGFKGVGTDKYFSEIRNCDVVETLYMR